MTNCLIASQENTDSLKRDYENNVAAVQAFIELRYFKQLDSVNTRLLEYRKSQFEASQHSLNYYMNAFKQCDEVTVPELKKGIKLRDEKFNELNKTLKKEKSQAFGKGFGIGFGTGSATIIIIATVLKFAVFK